jgi:heme A synthase
MRVNSPMPETVGRGLRALAVSAVAATYVLIVVGAVVRVTGSGLGCGDHWPLCNGYLIPIFDLPTLIEWSHRLAASLVSLLMLATVAVALWKYRSLAAVMRPLLVAGALLIWQIVLGAITVKLDLSPTVVALHLATALAYFAAMLTVAVATFRPVGLRFPTAGGHDRLGGLLLTTALAVYALVITGAFVAATGAKAVCAGWPLCNGSPFPATSLQVVHMFHRYMAGGVGLLVIVAVASVFRQRPARRDLRPAAGALLALMLTQIAVGAVNVLRVFPARVNGLHIALASAMWGASVVLAVLALQES